MELLVKDVDLEKGEEEMGGGKRRRRPRSLKMRMPTTMRRMLTREAQKMMKRRKVRRCDEGKRGRGDYKEYVVEDTSNDDKDIKRKS